MSSRVAAWRTGLVVAVLVLGTVALFSRAFPYPFTNYDDTSYLTNNPHVQEGLTWSSVRWAFTGATDYWHPLTWLSHMLDWQLYGDQAGGHRLTSILWHAVNTVLVLLVLRRLTDSFWTSAVCAALFAWHPLRVESVIWMPERKDVMSGCFFLLTLWAYVGYAERRASGTGGQRCWYGLTVGAFLGALMCKPVMVTLPGVLLLLDAWPLRRIDWKRGGSWARDAMVLSREKTALFVLSVVIAVVTLLMQHHAGAFTLDVPWPDRVGNAFVAIPRYLARFFWPVDLTVVYAHPGAWPAVTVALATALVLGISGVAMAQWRRRPWVLVGWGWFLVMLLPSIGLVQTGFQAMADRYTYVSMLGLNLALLWSGRDLFSRRTAAGAWAGALIAGFALGGCVLRTWQQQAVWRSPETLFEHALAVTEDNYAAHAFLGYTLANEGRIDEAEAHALAAVALHPRFSTGYDVLSIVRKAQGRPEDAIASLRQAIALAPRTVNLRTDLGELLLQRGDVDEAEAEFRRALEERPDFVGARNHLALLLAARGRAEEAVEQFEAALRTAPDLALTHFNYGSLLRQLGRIEEAMQHFRQAASLRPDDPWMWLGLGDVLNQLQHSDEAMAAFERALALRPGLPEGLCGRGEVLLLRREPAAAREQFEAALRVDPRSSRAYAGLAHVAALQERYDETVTNLRLALTYEPHNVDLRRRLGDVYGRAGQMAEASEQYAAAVRAQPGNAELRARLGYAFMIQQRYTEAVREWEEALRLQPNFPGLREPLARAREALTAGR